MRVPNGEVIRLRPKTYDLLLFLANNPGRILSKNELMAKVWPNVFVGEDNLFQCIRELRVALCDNKRELIRLVSGRGYVFEAESLDETDAVSCDEITVEPSACAEECPKMLSEPLSGEQTKSRSGIVPRHYVAILVVALIALTGILNVTVVLFPRTMPTPRSMIVAVMPIKPASEDPSDVQMAAIVTSRLVAGLTKIGSIRVRLAVATSPPADFVVSGELEKTSQAWNLQANMSEPITGIIRWTVSRSVDLTGEDRQLQENRLTAGIGHEVALRVNALESSGARAIDGVPLPVNAQVAIEQATTSFARTTPERFREAQAMLENALADDPGDIDLQIELAAFRLRWLEIAGSPPEGPDLIVTSARATLESALRAKPNYIPALETYCRLLSTTNQFIESLLVCGKALSQNPWDGVALNLVGIAQVHLGRFDEALATFTQADQFDTPRATGWRWTIGAGWTCLLMGHAEDALPWLQRSIAINPQSGRAQMLLAAAYQQLGRTDEARAAMAKGLDLRPDSTARNIPPAIKGDNPDYLRASKQLMDLMIAAGLPES